MQTFESRSGLGRSVEPGRCLKGALLFGGHKSAGLPACNGLKARLPHHSPHRPQLIIGRLCGESFVQSAVLSRSLPLVFGGGRGSGTQSLCTKDGPKKLVLQQIALQRLLDQSQAGPYIGENATYPPPHFWAFLGAIRVPYPKGLNCWLNPL